MGDAGEALQAPLKVCSKPNLLSRKSCNVSILLPISYCFSSHRTRVPEPSFVTLFSLLLSPSFHLFFHHGRHNFFSLRWSFRHVSGLFGTAPERSSYVLGCELERTLFYVFSNTNLWSRNLFELLVRFRKNTSFEIKGAGTYSVLKPGQVGVMNENYVHA